jgi:hypothetical protein
MTAGLTRVSPAVMARRAVPEVSYRCKREKRVRKKSAIGRRRLPKLIGCMAEVRKGRRRARRTLQADLKERQSSLGTERRHRSHGTESRRAHHIQCQRRSCRSQEYADSTTLPCSEEDRLFAIYQP